MKDLLTIALFATCLSACTDSNFAGASATAAKKPRPAAPVTDPEQDPNVKKTTPLVPPSPPGPLTSAVDPKPEDDEPISTTPATVTPAVQRVTFANNMFFDGHSLTCLNFKTGVVSVQVIEQKYFGTAISIVVDRPTGPATISISSAASAQIPDWKPFCGAHPNMPQAVPVDGDRDPTYLQPSVKGDQACLEIDDGARGHQPGGTHIVGFDFGLQPCP